MAKMSKASGTDKGGGLCCDHCSDSKYPCVHMEKRMRKETPGSPDQGAKKGEGDLARAEE